MNRARRRLLLVVGAVVALALVVAGAVALLGARGVDPVDQDVAGPVVLVPGYGGDADDLAPLAAALREQGREVVDFAPAEQGRGDLGEAAASLADLARRTAQGSAAGSVDVVGYSAGGVVARLMVREHDGASFTRRVLTLGSPHHGTDVAALAQEVAGGCPTACEQLATGSDLLRRLDAGDETPDGPAWVTVRTDRDQTVTPTDSAALEGALNVRVQEVCPTATTSHGDLPGDPVVLALLPLALGESAPSAPSAAACVSG